MIQVAMTPKGTSVHILGCLSLLLISTCKATVRPTNLELILDSVKNIEGLMRDSYLHQPVYLVSPAGRKGIVNSPYPLRQRDITVNFDPAEEVVREHLQRHPKRPNSENLVPSQSSTNENVNSNSNDSQLRDQSEDDSTTDKPSRSRLGLKPRNDEGALDDNGNGNVNSNSNSNSNTNSNSNGRRRNSEDIDVPSKNAGINKRPRYGSGVRSLSRQRDTNRNINSNVNTNTMSDDDDVIYDEI